MDGRVNCLKIEQTSKVLIAETFRNCYVFYTEYQKGKNDNNNNNSPRPSCMLLFQDTRDFLTPLFQKWPMSLQVAEEEVDQQRTPKVLWPDTEGTYPNIFLNI